MASPKALNVFFTENLENSTFDKSDVLYSDLLYFWPTFEAGDLVTLLINDLDEPDSLMKGAIYKVIRTNYIIVNPNEQNEGIHTLAVYVSKVPKPKKQNGDFEIEFV